MAGFVVGLEPGKDRSFLRIESEFLAFLDKKILLLGVIQQRGSFHFVGPASHIFRGVLFAVIVEPSSHFHIARPFLNLGFEIGPLHAFESEEHVVQKGVKMIRADISADQRATFIDCASENRISADAHSGTARRDLGQVQACNLCLHVKKAKEN